MFPLLTGATMAGRAASMPRIRGYAWTLRKWLGTSSITRWPGRGSLGQTYQQTSGARHRGVVGGRAATRKGGPPLEPADLEEFNKLRGALDAVAGTLDVAAPWPGRAPTALTPRRSRLALGDTASERRGRSSG